MQIHIPEVLTPAPLIPNLQNERGSVGWKDSLDPDPQPSSKAQGKAGQPETA